ncbi:MAG: DeoR/GlpR family DNA-binding transcription regulator [Bifidobacteriaceae bacterium]|nr:DeoR/GlpR family DNA-binding transcription regulator [Bifidobacteriaceae bacterium]
MDENEALSVAERRMSIIELLITQERASIAELAKLFGVSHMTIRRDLGTLAAERRVDVGRGEARLSHYAGVEPDYAAKQRTNAALKARLARYAADNFVECGDVIMLEGGTTVTAMAQYLHRAQRLTVITNGMYTTNELSRLLPETTVICTGGVLRDTSFTYVGPQVEDLLSTVHARSLFMSATGFTAASGLTDPNPLEVQARRRMAASAERVIALIDSSKFGVTSAIRTAGTKEIDVFVTDSGAPKRELDLLRRAGVDVHVV